MAYIELTRKNGEPIYINTDNVLFIKPTGKENQATYVALKSGGNQGENTNKIVVEMPYEEACFQRLE